VNKAGELIKKGHLEIKNYILELKETQDKFILQVYDKFYQLKFPTEVVKIDEDFKKLFYKKRNYFETFILFFKALFFLNKLKTKINQTIKKLI